MNACFCTTVTFGDVFFLFLEVKLPQYYLSPWLAITLLHFSRETNITKKRVNILLHCLPTVVSEMGFKRHAGEFGEFSHLTTLIDNVNAHSGDPRV